MDIFVAIACGATGAAFVSGFFGVVMYILKKKDDKKDKENVEKKALRYIMLYIIQERCKELIEKGEITLDELRSVRHWHNLYHNDLGGNGDADLLMKRVEELKIVTD